MGRRFKMGVHLGDLLVHVSSINSCFRVFKIQIYAMAISVYGVSLGAHKKPFTDEDINSRSHSQKSLPSGAGRDRPDVSANIVLSQQDAGAMESCAQL